MNLYLYGHGFQLKTGPTWPTNMQVNTNFPITPDDFEVPQRVTIHFYVEDGVSFDSMLEPYLFNAAVQNVTDDRTTGILRHRTFTTGQRCINHVLTRPGAMQTMVAPANVKEIVPELDNQNVPRLCHIVGPLHDTDTLAVKQGGKLPLIALTNEERQKPIHTYLHAVVTAIAQAVPNEQLHIHWLACKSYMLLVDDNGDVWSDATEQARNAWNTMRGAWGATPPRAIRDVPVNN